jgi:hypothetical protein
MWTTTNLPKYCSTEIIDGASGLRYSRAEWREGVMRTFLLAGLVAMVAFSANASAQAAAEAVLTHSISTGIGTHVGTALGNATNRLAGRVAQQTSTAVPHQVITTVKPGAGGNSKVSVASTAPAPPSGNGSLIASIQGGERQPTGCAATAKAADAKAPAKAAMQNNCTAAAQAKDDHPSVVNLPAAQ